MRYSKMNDDSQLEIGMDNPASHDVVITGLQNQLRSNTHHPDKNENMIVPAWLNQKNAGAHFSQAITKHSDHYQRFSGYENGVDCTNQVLGIRLC